MEGEKTTQQKEEPPKEQLSSKEKAQEYKKKGNEYFMVQRYEEAILCYNEAIKLDVSDAVFYSNRSIAFLALQQYEEALHDAMQCVALKPEWDKVRLRDFGKRDSYCSPSLLGSLPRW